MFIKKIYIVVKDTVKKEAEKDYLANGTNNRHVDVLIIKLCFASSLIVLVIRI